MDLTLKNELEKVVTEILSEKEEASQKDLLVETLEDAKAKLEEAAVALSDKDAKIEELTVLTASIDEVKASVEVKDEELAKTLEELGAEKAKVVEHTTTVEAKDVELSSVKENLETVSTELAELKKEIILEKRMASLKSVELLRSDEAGVKAQQEKVAELSEEEFASYKEELEDIKGSIVESLKGKTAAKKEETKEEKAAREEEAKEKEAEEAANEAEKAAKEVEEAVKEKASTIINLEGDKDVTTKDIGEAMVEIFKIKK